MVSVAKLTVYSPQLESRSAEFWFRGIHGRHRQLQRTTMMDAKDIIMNLAQYHTPKGKTYKLVDSWRWEMVHQGVKVFNIDPKLPFVDQPTRPHKITARNAQALKLPEPFGFKKSVNHPGTKGHRFIRKIYFRATKRIFNLVTKRINALLK
jgi:hypothetical protein